MVVPAEVAQQQSVTLTLLEKALTVKLSSLLDNLSMFLFRSARSSACAPPLPSPAAAPAAASATAVVLARQIAHAMMTRIRK